MNFDISAGPDDCIKCDWGYDKLGIFKNYNDNITKYQVVIS